MDTLVKENQVDVGHKLDIAETLGRRSTRRTGKLCHWSGVADAESAWPISH